MGEIDIDGLIVEWDDNKASLNYKKHGISFEKAAEIFLDEFLMNPTLLFIVERRRMVDR